jgi:acyl-coenzyme A thioesterase PaaI-like protein
MSDISAPSLPSDAASSPRRSLGGLAKALRRGRPTDRIRIAWDTLHTLPLGRKLFSWIIGRVAPYSGSIKAEVIDLRVGFAQCRMRDRRRLRNHLRSLHAIALSNLAELTGNIALAYSIPGDARFIVKRMGMEYFAKARGDITAICSSAMPADNAEQDVEISIELKDAQGTLVARASLFSLVGPVKDAVAPAGDAHPPGRASDRR